MDMTIETPLSCPSRVSRKRSPARIAAGIALLLVVTATLIFIAASRYPATPDGGHRTEQPALVPHPAPGPYGS